MRTILGVMFCLVAASSWAGQKCSPESRTEKSCVPQEYDCDSKGRCKTKSVCTTKEVRTERCYYVPDSNSSSNSSKSSSNKGAQ